MIEEGAYADLLVVGGNPPEDISAVGGSEAWFDAPDRDGVDTMRIIMKDGAIYKNTLRSSQRGAAAGFPSSLGPSCGSLASRENVEP